MSKDLMRCILMNKNMPVVELELDDDTATILKVIKNYELDYLQKFRAL